MNLVSRTANSCVKGEMRMSRALPLRTTNFPEEHERVERINWTCHNVQMSPGLFRGSLFDTEVNGVVCGLEGYNLPMEEMVGAPPGRVLYVRGESSGEVLCQGRPLDRHLGIVCAQQAPLHFLVRGNYSGFYVAIDSAAVDRLVPDFDWRKNLGREIWAAVSQQQSATLDAAVRVFLQCLAHDPAAASLKPLSEEIITAIADVLDRRAGLAAAGRPQTRAYVFRTARNYILDRLDRDLTVQEICDALRVSQRTLEYSFIEVTGVGPKQFILTQKLNRVHSDIVRTSGATDVLLLAQRWGFNHPSRFARQYHRQFLELPSQTKRRIQVTCR